MTRSTGISEAEWQVMSVLWRAAAPDEGAGLTAAEIVATLADESDWHPRTIKTMLGRLVRKGALSYTAEGNRYLYRAAVTQQQCVRAASRSFLERVFEGNAALAVMHLVESSKLSQAEIERLRTLLEEMRK